MLNEIFSFFKSGEAGAKVSAARVACGRRQRAQCGVGGSGQTDSRLFSISDIADVCSGCWSMPRLHFPFLLAQGRKTGRRRFCCDVMFRR
jgi:hypothetical protein